MKTSASHAQAFSAIALSVACLFGGARNANAEAIETGHCSITGAGTLASGLGFTVSVIDSAEGVPSGTFSYTRGQVQFVSSAVTLLFCRVNGVVIGDVEGIGSFNGVDGHRFLIQIHDRGVPQLLPGTPEIRTVTASRRYSPTRWEDGNVEFAFGAQLTLPDALPVSVGNGGNGRARLTIIPAGGEEPIECDYRGGASTANPWNPDDIAAGQRYLFQHCNQVDAETGRQETLPLAPGSVVEASAVRLRVQHGSGIHPSAPAPLTTVSVGLNVTPYQRGITDFFVVRVIDTMGNLVDAEEGDLTTGDTTVQLLQ